MQISKSILALVAAVLILFMGCALAVSAQDIRPVPASEIVGLIKNNEPVEYDHIIVVGDLDLSKLNITSPIRITDSRFDGIVSLNDTTLGDDIVLQSCNFTRFADFSGSTFSRKADFSRSTFRGDAIFLNSTFCDGADFSGSTFSRVAFFYESTFSGGADFSRSILSGANFYGSTFGWDADFIGSTFSSFAYFHESTFGGDADFSGSTFGGDADFSGSTFSSFAYFTDSTFSRKADFTESKIHGAAGFSGTVFSGYAIFNFCKFYTSARFIESEFKDKARFENARFLGELFLVRADYEELYIRWNSISKLYFEESVYLKLIENFKNLGYYPDADQCYVSYRNANRQNLPLYYQPIDWLLWILYGYGTMPELPIIWSLLVIVLCGGFFYFTADIETPDKKTTLMEAMYLSAAAFTSGARTLGGFVSTPEDVKVKGRARYVLAAEKLLGLLLVGLFLTALARTVIR